MDINIISTPFSMIVNGPSSSGKTFFVKRILRFREEMLSPVPTKIIYCYSKWQSSYLEMSGPIEFVEGIDYTIDKAHSYLIIFDDLMTSMNKKIMDLFISGRHERISVIFLTHNLFYRNEFMRTISLNATYIVCFKSPRDSSSVRYLGQQLFPGNHKFLEESFNDATSSSRYGYILIDMRGHIENKYRLRTNIFPDEILNVYFPLK